MLFDWTCLPNASCFYMIMEIVTRANYVSREERQWRARNRGVKLGRAGHDYNQWSMPCRSNASIGRPCRAPARYLGPLCGRIAFGPIFPIDSIWMETANQESTTWVNANSLWLSGQWGFEKEDRNKSLSSIIYIYRPTIGVLPPSILSPLLVLIKSW